MSSTNNPLPSVLVVDDTPINLSLMTSVLKGLCKVKVANNGIRALEIARSSPPPDLILLDVMMPGMDGIELAKRAVEMNATLKVMFITGFAAVALHPASGAPKQAKVLSKPFHLREIVAEVDRMLAAA